MDDDATPGALRLTDGLGAAGARDPSQRTDGAFFTVAQMRAVTMTELAELRAKRGFCPKCQAQKLRHISSGGGMVFRQCRECNTVAVLGA